MNFIASIGLEIHVEMKTRSKMFSSAPVTYGNKPNTAVNPLDIAFPGSMPTVNKQAVINAIQVGNALNMSIDDELWFDRKNYFYSDLAKGYQITQQFRPIGKQGYLEIETNKGKKKINIERLHIEEDTCKQLHEGEYTYLDYNRSGIPLLEIVSKPELETGDEAMKFVEKIRSIVTFLNVSDGKMEEGSLRVDVNVSIHPIGSAILGTNVEIKNLNSLSNIQKAIDYEINRQQSILLSGNKVNKETRRFDESSKATVMMREKVESVDYRYFTDPNIVPIKLSKDFIEEAIKSSPELPEVKYQRYISLGLNEYDASLLTMDKDICDYFDEVIKNKAKAKLAANWINVDIKSILKKENISIKEFKISPQNLAKLLILIDEGKISNKQAREPFFQMLKGENNLEEHIDTMGTSMINDKEVLLNIVKQVLERNPQSVIDYRNGKDRAIGYLIAQVMKLTNGRANPSLTNKLIVEQIKGD